MLENYFTLYHKVLKFSTVSEQTSDVGQCSHIEFKKEKIYYEKVFRYDVGSYHAFMPDACNDCICIHGYGS